MEEEIQDDDDVSSESHSEYETESGSELDSSEDDSKHPMAQRRDVPKVTGMAVKIGKDDSESKSGSSSIASENNPRIQPSRREDTPQNKEARTAGKNVNPSGKCVPTHPDLSKSKRKARTPGRLNLSDKRSKPDHLGTESSSVTEMPNYTMANRSLCSKKQKLDHL